MNNQRLVGEEGSLKRFLKKHEVLFVLVLIEVYIVGLTVAKQISAAAALPFLGEAVYQALCTAALMVWIVRKRLTGFFGLCRSSVPAVKMLFYLPLMLTAASSVLMGVSLRYPEGAKPEQQMLSLVLRSVSMLFVGFLEEILFRGFLFRSIAKKNLTAGVLCSSVLFGLCHFSETISWDTVMPSLMNIVLALAAGFLLVMIFVRTGSLLVCIVFHSVNNILTGFLPAERLLQVFGSEQTVLWVNFAFRFVLIVLYLLYVWKCLPKRNALRVGELFGEDSQNIPSTAAQKDSAFR